MSGNAVASLLLCILFLKETDSQETEINQCSVCKSQNKILNYPKVNEEFANGQPISYLRFVQELILLDC